MQDIVHHERIDYVKQFPKVSIIIACRRICSDTRKCVEECLKLDYPDYEIIILPDQNETLDKPQVIIIPTGSVKPSTKRNIGMRQAMGEIFAFIDSDAYPTRDWLKKAVGYFSLNQNIGAVTGPNITPPEDSFWQKIGGEILESFVGLGRLSRRYRLKGNQFETNDIMSCNFIISKKIAEALDGFDQSLLTGEDYKLGLEIISLGKKIIFTPEVCVFHHRRSVFKPHLKQIWNYGRDKGILMHEFFGPDKIMYFLPSAYTIWFIVGFFIACFINNWFSELYIISIFLYFIVLLADSLRIRDWKMFFLVFIGIWFTHLTYGIAFLYGIICRKNKWSSASIE